MGKRGKPVDNSNSPDQWNSGWSGQKKADEFDKTFNGSKDRADEARSKGEYPYDLDGKFKKS